MIAGSSTQLVEKVAEAIKRAPKRRNVVRMSMNAEGVVTDEEIRFDTCPRLQAQAALVACHAEEMWEAIQILVYAKDMRERDGDTPAYRAKKEEGWSRARALLVQLSGQP